MFAASIAVDAWPICETMTGQANTTDRRGRALWVVRSQDGLQGICRFPSVKIFRGVQISRHERLSPLTWQTRNTGGAGLDSLNWEVRF